MGECEADIPICAKREVWARCRTGGGARTRLRRPYRGRGRETCAQRSLIRLACGQVVAEECWCGSENRQKRQSFTVAVAVLVGGLLLPPEQPVFLHEKAGSVRKRLSDFAQSCDRFFASLPILFLRILIAPGIGPDRHGGTRGAGTTAERMRRQPDKAQNQG